MAFTQKFTRRTFMQGCSAAIAAMAGSRISNLAFADPKAMAPDYEIVIVVFLRGGIDGLNVIIPTGGASNDRAIYEATLRPTLKIPTSGDGSALPIGNLGNTSFGMNPAMSPLHGLFQSGYLAVVHATGLTSNNRSHFDSMQFMEAGVPDNKSIGTGWLARHLNTLGGIPTAGTFPALSASSGVARSLSGRDDAIALTGSGGLNLYAWGDYATTQRERLRNMYQVSDPNQSTWLHVAGENALNALDLVGDDSDYTPTPGVNYPDQYGFGGNLMTIAKMIKQDVGLRAATVDLGGWDTHESQQDGSRGGAGGQFYNLIDHLSRGLLAFFQDLGVYTKRTTIVVMSEFGRTLKENANRGTDHGHGNIMLVMGGGINGGKIYGQWPGLSDLYDGRDLKITTDYRHILSELVVTRFANNVANLPTVFPSYTPPSQWLGLAKNPPREFSGAFKLTYLPVIKR
jgi:uncharacterized protein (DUF1501 family)